MTPSQPDTETLVAEARAVGFWLGGESAPLAVIQGQERVESGIRILAARLAETEAQRNRAEKEWDQLSYRYDAIAGLVATLEAALLLVDECADVLTEDGYAYLVATARDALDSLPQKENT